MSAIICGAIVVLRDDAIHRWYKAACDLKDDWLHGSWKFGITFTVVLDGDLDGILDCVSKIFTFAFDHIDIDEARFCGSSLARLLVRGSPVPTLLTCSRLSMR